jgi:hypothetical protein
MLGATRFSAAAPSTRVFYACAAPEKDPAVCNITSEDTRACGYGARARKRPNGKFDVTVEVETHKYKADAKGVETEVPVDDWI